MQTTAANRILSFVFLTSFASIGQAQSTDSIGTLLHYDFNQVVAWPITSEQPNEPGVASGKFGTIDKSGSNEPSGGLALIIESGPQPGWIYEKTGFVHRTDVPINENRLTDSWSSKIESGLIPIMNAEANLGKLTLSFDLSASRALPIRVLVESFNSEHVFTGALQTSIFPAAADFYQRYAIDLSTMKPIGEGTFDPTAPYVSFTFETNSDLGWPAFTAHELRLDNVHYARAAYYVSPAGSDSNDGLTESTPFATPQKAIDAAHPGDIVLLMIGTYKQGAQAPPKTPVAKFVRPGMPAKWITLKNYPGHKPMISSHGQNAINLTYGNDGVDLGYIEVRGLTVRGNGDSAKAQFPNEIGKSTPNTDTMGIVINGRKNPYNRPRVAGEIVHHIRLANNVVDFCTADGIYVEYCDWLFLEKNTIQNNCWTTTGYAPSGLAVMGHANFDSQDNAFKILIAGNEVSGNRLTVFNHPRNKTPRTDFYNGDGILLDDNAGNPPNVYLGRTLVQNNLVFNNGGGGIQMWGSHRVDLINNTVHLNGTNLAWGQFGFERCRDVRLVNNIIVASPETPLDTWFAGRMDERTAGIVRMNNLYWGGAKPNVVGINDLVAEPSLTNPTTDPASADFKLNANSPALKAGRWELFSPIVDIHGNPRPLNGSPSIGAFER